MRNPVSALFSSSQWGSPTHAASRSSWLGRGVWVITSIALIALLIKRVWPAKQQSATSPSQASKGEAEVGVSQPAPSAPPPEPVGQIAKDLAEEVEELNLTLTVTENGSGWLLNSAGEQRLIQPAFIPYEPWKTADSVSEEIKAMKEQLDRVLNFAKVCNANLVDRNLKLEPVFHGWKVQTTDSQRCCLQDPPVIFYSPLHTAGSVLMCAFSLGYTPPAPEPSAPPLEYVEEQSTGIEFNDNWEKWVGIINDICPKAYGIGYSPESRSLWVWFNDKGQWTETEFGVYEIDEYPNHQRATYAVLKALYNNVATGVVGKQTSGRILRRNELEIGELTQQKTFAQFIDIDHLPGEKKQLSSAVYLLEMLSRGLAALCAGQKAKCYIAPKGKNIFASLLLISGDETKSEEIRVYLVDHLLEEKEGGDREGFGEAGRVFAEEFLKRFTLPETEVTSQLEAALRLLASECCRWQFIPVSLRMTLVDHLLDVVNGANGRSWASFLAMTAKYFTEEQLEELKTAVPSGK